MTMTTDTTPKNHDEQRSPASDPMRAITQDRYGNSSVLTVANVDRPEIGSEQVLVEVVAAGIDRGTEHLMTGQPYLVRLAGYGLTKPKNPVPGLDVAGRVIAIGAAVTRFAVGDEVFGIANGSLAEFASADEDKLALKPSNISFEQASVSAVSGITALQSLTDVGGLEPGQTVLIIGASGGVGTFALQLAKALGGHVDGVAGKRNLELVRSLGAERVIDHQETRIADIDHEYDLVLDIGGRNSVHDLRKVVSKKGTLVIVGGENGNRITGGIGRQLLAMLLSPFVAQRLATFISKEHYSSMERLGTHLESGEVTPSIGARFDLDDTADAMRLMETGQLSGKTVIAIQPPESGSD
jgi:NADPH:quinone reductase-like Zn-dependent oxidoreductase